MTLQGYLLYKWSSIQDLCLMLSQSAPFSSCSLACIANGGMYRDVTKKCLFFILVDKLMKSLL